MSREWGPAMGFVSMEEETDTEALSSLSPSLLCAMEGHGKKVDIGKPGRGPSQMTEFADALILDLPASRTVRDKCCCLSHPGFGNLLSSPN